MRTMLMLALLLASCTDDELCPDAAQLVDASLPDAEPCGETWGRCCANDAPQRCNPEAICNIHDVCEAMCFPYCPDAGE